MPFRLNENRAKIQFIAPIDMPWHIRQAAERVGICSNTVYIQHAVCEALARDLGLDLQDLLDSLPEPRTNAKSLRGLEKGRSEHESVRWG